VTNDYQAFLVSQAFVDGIEDNNCIGRQVGFGATPSSQYNPTFEHLSSMLHNGSLERLERTQCITEYAKMVQSTRRNLLLVATNEDVRPKTNASSGLPSDRPCIDNVKNNTGVYWMDQFWASIGLDPTLAENSYQWICLALQMSGEQRDVPCGHLIEEVREAPNWRMYGWYADSWSSGNWTWKVDYCLSEPVTSRCELHFSTVIAVIVTVLNFCKSTNSLRLYLLSTLYLLDVSFVRLVRSTGTRS
jgi:hypothetical protein